MDLPKIYIKMIWTLQSAVASPPLSPPPPRCPRLHTPCSLTSHSSPFQIRPLHRRCATTSSTTARDGGSSGLGDKKSKTGLPDIVKAGDPVLHEPVREVDPNEIGSERIQKVIDDMVKVMRRAPQIGIPFPLRIIVLEDTSEYISYQPMSEIKAQDRRAFDLLVTVNPKLIKKSKRTALFFEGCLSVDGFRADVERFLDVEVSGLDRDGKPIKADASGW